MYFFCSCRVEKIPLRHFLTIRTNIGHPGRQEPKDEGAGVCYFQRGQQCVQCFEIYAGLPFLRQTHGRFMETAFFFHVKHAIVWNQSCSSFKIIVAFKSVFLSCSVSSMPSKTRTLLPKWRGLTWSVTVRKRGPRGSRDLREAAARRLHKERPEPWWQESHRPCL